WTGAATSTRTSKPDPNRRSKKPAQMPTGLLRPTTASRHFTWCRRMESLHGTRAVLGPRPALDRTIANHNRDQAAAPHVVPIVVTVAVRKVGSLSAPLLDGGSDATRR